MGDGHSSVRRDEAKAFLAVEARTSSPDPDPDDMRLLTLLIRGCDVMEIYSPERIGRACKQHGLVAGPALDL